MHDEFCPNEDDQEDCKLCRIIKMVRRDEQDKYSGDEEMDREAVYNEAYAKGYDAGVKKGASTPIVKSNSLSLSGINQYILNGVSTRTLQQTQALYDLYIHLGGK